MDQFRQGLHNDVKDLLLTFHEDPKSLTEAISQVVDVTIDYSSNTLSVNNGPVRDQSRHMHQ